jgi:hypothetical protein
MAACARMEWVGVPIDTEILAQLRENWDSIKGKLIEQIDAQYGVFVPVEQRVLNPGTRLGAAIFEVAGQWQNDPYRLADAVDVVWAEEKVGREEGVAARRAARQETGLTHRRIDQLEDAGKDHTSVPNLDVTARELASQYPGLGLGRGYDPDAPDEEYGGQLWELLRERDERIRPKHDPEILRSAAELVAATPDLGPNYSRPMRFSSKRWAEYLARKGIPWPRLESGALDLKDDTFRSMARAYPLEVGPIRELRYALSQLRLNQLAVGADGRNRCLLSAFGSKTGRNQPSNTSFIFGPSCWLRSLIRPEPGRGLAYVDWSAQEYGIAACLSGDQAMQGDYLSGDPYLALAKRARAVPPDATKASHPRERELFKVCCGLGAMYGAGAKSLATRLGVSEFHARQLLLQHRMAYRTFWAWSDAFQDGARLRGYVETVWGWRLRLDGDVNPRSLRNFPMQAHGAEMMRLACCLATERGISVCCPVHDALVVEGPENEIEDVVAATRQAMKEASELVLRGFQLWTDAKIVRHPDRYRDERGRQMWDTVTGLLPTLAVAETG